MTESLEPALYYSIIPTRVSLLTSIAYQKVLIFLLIFTKERSATKFTHNTEEFFTPKSTKVEVTVEGVPNELYAQNMEYRHQYDEIVKHFEEG